MLPKPKQTMTIRLDADLLDWLRRQKGHQTRINAVLRDLHGGPQVAAPPARTEHSLRLPDVPCREQPSVHPIQPASAPTLQQGKVGDLHEVLADRP